MRFSITRTFFILGFIAIFSISVFAQKKIEATSPSSGSIDTSFFRSLFEGIIKIFIRTAEEDNETRMTREPSVSIKEGITTTTLIERTFPTPEPARDFKIPCEVEAQTCKNSLEGCEREKEDLKWANNQLEGENEALRKEKDDLFDDTTKLEDEIYGLEKRGRDNGQENNGVIVFAMSCETLCSREGKTCGAALLKEATIGGTKTIMNSCFDSSDPYTGNPKFLRYCLCCD